MNHQTGAVFKLTATVTTDVFSVVITHLVSLHVYFQVPVVVVSSTTHLTYYPFLLQVETGNVALKMGFRFKAFTTVVAAEWSFSFVVANVPSQRRLESKFLVAKVALEVPFSLMTCFVFFVVGVAFELFRAKPALVGHIPSVNFFDV